MAITHLEDGRNHLLRIDLRAALLLAFSNLSLDLVGLVLLDALAFQVDHLLLLLDLLAADFGL
jgi:hypothetical protein